jgi:hypothetical protein
MCDSVMPEALAAVIDKVSGILIIVSIFIFDNCILYRTLPLWEEFLLHTDVDMLAVSIIMKTIKISTLLEVLLRDVSG